MSAVVLAALMVGTTACTSSTADGDRSAIPKAPSTPAEASSSTEPTEPSLIPGAEQVPGQIVVPVPDPSALVTAFGSAWVQSGTDLWRVSRVGHVVARLADVVQAPLDQGLTTVVAGFGAIWTIRGERVFRIAPSTDRVVGRIPLPGAAWGLTVASDGVWVVCCRGYVTLRRIDPATDAIDRRERLGTSTAGMMGGPGALWWIDSSEAASVSRFDVVTWDETYIRTPFYTQQVVVTPTWTWLIGDGYRARVAPEGGKATRIAQAAAGPIALGATYANATVWLNTGNLVGFDADSGAPVTRLHVSGFERADAVAGIGVLGPRIWMADPFGDRLVGVRTP